MLTKKGKRKTKRDETAAPVLYAKLIYSEKTKKFFLFLKQKESKKLIFLKQYCKVKMALIIEGIFISKTVTSLQIKIHEVYIKPLKPRELILTIKERDDEDEDEDDNEENKTLNISDIEED